MAPATAAAGSDATDGGLSGADSLIDVIRRALQSDLGVYLLSGAFATLVFVVGLVVLAATLPGGLGRRHLAGFVAGFLLFVAVYVVAMGIYRGIDAFEDV